jgi:2-keto-4-pentenoate hydratase/2-oxohepta-3-ene-1,7-dioic acid hydratase in catechol pathway
VKLITFRKPGGADRLGALLPSGDTLDLSASADPAFASMLTLIEAGPVAWDRARALVGQAPIDLRVDKAAFELRAPIPLPPQFRDSMSFHKHIFQSRLSTVRRIARESGDDRAIAEAERFAANYQVPEIYRKQPTYYKANRFNVADPGETVTWPVYSQLMDFELELACVIGVGGKNIPREKAGDHIFGFMIFNDLSARDAQAREMEGRLGPAKGKDFDKANVFGPCLVTADEIGDPYALRMSAKVNGEVWCDTTSADMYWKFEDLIAYISQDETLHPGEIIGSGTVGDGCGLEHNRFLNSGDTIELEIEKVGVLRTRVLHPFATSPDARAPNAQEA